MSACVYIRFDCPACERVATAVRENDLDDELINVQLEKSNIAEIQIFPSLYIDGELKAFGDDILQMLKKC